MGAKREGIIPLENKIIAVLLILIAASALALVSTDVSVGGQFAAAVIHYGKGNVATDQELKAIAEPPEKTTLPEGEGLASLTATSIGVHRGSDLVKTITQPPLPAF